MRPRKTADDLKGRVIDVHAHVGVSLKSYGLQEYPYAETVESLYHKQLAGGVDVNVVFPFTPDLHFDLHTLVEKGIMVPDGRPLSPLPYRVENELLLREVYEYCPELADRFLPFVCMDPGRDQERQVGALRELAERYPVYGIKIVPVLCQSRAIDLLDCPAFFEFAAEFNLPVLFHATSQASEGYSYAGDLFQIIDRHPELRYCLAHCLLFHDGFLRQADARANVWVDTAALKIQVELFRQSASFVSDNPAERFPSDYHDHCRVMVDLAEAFPDTMLWGTDSPAYAYIVKRRRLDGSFTDFHLKGTYRDEIDALRSLPDDLARRVAGENALRFIFGPA